MMSFGKEEENESTGLKAPSRLRQWPIQLHLVSPQAPYYQGADVLLAADCTAFAMGSFHEDYLKGRSIAILCPKLDADQEIYVEKIRGLIEESKINSLTVGIMQVPCCRGVLGLVVQAVKASARKVPIRVVVVGLQGNILQDEAVEV
jgi:hypothetical protein